MAECNEILLTIAGGQFMITGMEDALSEKLPDILHENIGFSAISMTSIPI